MSEFESESDNEQIEQINQQQQQQEPSQSHESSQSSSSSSNSDSDSDSRSNSDSNCVIPSPSPPIIPKIGHQVMKDIPIYEFENWTQTNLADLLTIDKQKHFSNARIDAYIDCVYKYNQKRLKLIEANPDTNVNELEIDWSASDFIYPKGLTGSSPRQTFRNFFDKEKLKIDYENRVLIVETGLYFDNNPVSKFTGRIVLRPQYLDALWVNAHVNPGHVETSAVSRNIRTKYWIWKMNPWIKARRNLCSCRGKSNKAAQKKYIVGQSDLQIAPPPVEVAQIYHIDLSVSYPKSHAGNRYMLHTVCPKSRYLILSPMKDKEALTICHYLRHDVFRYFGFPSSIYSDNGREFKNQDLEAISEILDIKVHNTQAMRPQANSYAELSVNKWKTWLKRLLVNEGDYSMDQLKHMKNYPRDWDQYSDRGMFEINNSSNVAALEKPQHVMINQGNQLKYYLLDLRKAEQLKLKQKTDKNSKHISDEDIDISDNNQNNCDSKTGESKITELREAVSQELNELDIADCMLYMPPDNQKSFAYGTSNCFGQNANDPTKKKTALLYSPDQRLMRDSIFATQSWNKKCQYKRNWDKNNVHWSVGTKVQYKNGKKWNPKLFVLYTY